MSVPPEHPPAYVPFARTVFALCVVGLFVVAQLYTVLPVLGSLAASWSTTAASAGWTATAFGFGYAAGFLFSGPLSDRFGRRRLIINGLLLTALATAAVAAAPNLPVGCALRTLQGLCAASFAPPAFSYIAGHIAPARRVTAMTWLTSSFLAAGVLGQVFAQLLVETGGWRAVFLVSAALLACGAVVLHYVLAEDTAAAVSSAREAYRAMGRLLAAPALLLLLVTTLTLLCSFVTLYTALQLSGPVSVTNNPDMLLALRASSLPAMLCVPLVTTWLVRLTAVHRIATALLTAALVALLTALFASGGTNIFLLSGLLFLFVFGIAVTAPALVEAIGALAGTARGAAVALYTFALFVGASMGPQLAAALPGGFAGAALGAAVLLVGGAGCAVGSIRGGRSSPTTADGL
ncbi:MFS transporter [Streptomyces sp. NPDC048384]|uniref:MFS transporter n=1 Tax=Streptomyces sp. NPDC048384 TaxID=3155487 RepID=UPI0034209240